MIRDVAFKVFAGCAYCGAGVCGAAFLVLSLNGVIMSPKLKEVGLLMVQSGLLLFLAGFVVAMLFSSGKKDVRK